MAHLGICVSMCTTLGTTGIKKLILKEWCFGGKGRGESVILSGNTRKGPLVPTLRIMCPALSPWTPLDRETGRKKRV